MAIFGFFGVTAPIEQVWFYTNPCIIDRDISATGNRKVITIRQPQMLRVLCVYKDKL